MQKVWENIMELTHRLRQKNVALPLLKIKYIFCLDSVVRKLNASECNKMCIRDSLYTIEVYRLYIDNALYIELSVINNF